MCLYVLMYFRVSFSNASIHLPCWRNLRNVYNSDVGVVLGSLVNAVRNHETALHMAAEHQSYIFIMMLLDFGADVSMENLWGRKAIEMVQANSPLYNLLLAHESII